MPVKRLQNKVSQSRITLPIVSFYALLIWFLGGIIQKQLWITFSCFIVSSYLMMELNNANSLIRTYSRLVSCSFIMLTCMIVFAFDSMPGAIIQLCAVAFYLILFHSYQEKHASIWVYYAFLCLGLGSIINIKILYYVPIIWIIMIFKLGCMSGRTFWASIIGIITPYWFIATYYLYRGDINPFIKHFKEFIQLYPITMPYEVLSANQIITLIFILILAIIGIVHYTRKSYNDKIRVRMLFDTFITLDIVSFIFLALQPQYYDILLRIIIINTSPLIGHYFALTRTWLTNMSFIILVIMTMLLSAFNLWMPSFTF